MRRAALVSLVPFARRGRMLDMVYELALDHFDDPEDLMHKATGWVLREAGKTDRSRLRDFLRQHGPALPRTALRYAIEHFPKPERQRLLASTRPAAHLEPVRRLGGTGYQRASDGNLPPDGAAGW